MPSKTRFINLLRKALYCLFGVFLSMNQDPEISISISPYIASHVDVRGDFSKKLHKTLKEPPIERGQAWGVTFSKK